MSNIIKAVATAMIIILIAILLWIFLSYYKGNESVGILSSNFSSGSTNVSTLEISSGNVVGTHGNNSNANEGLIESIIKNSDEKHGPENTTEFSTNSGDSIIDEKIEQTQSGENIINDNSSDNNTSEEHKSEDNDSGENIPDTIIEIPEDDEPNQILITSDSQTSNQQKQEILTEIDKALQGLLEAVGKVEVVDEERLDATLSSEVVES